jgi:hypothetical protein
MKITHEATPFESVSCVPASNSASTVPRRSAKHLRKSLTAVALPIQELEPVTVVADSDIPIFSFLFDFRASGCGLWRERRSSLRWRGAAETADGLLLGTREKIADDRRDFVAMRLERKVARIKEAHLRARDVAFERLRTRWQKERIVLTPHSQKRRLVLTKIALELGIQRDVALIISEEIELNFIGAGARQIKVV